MNMSELHARNMHIFAMCSRHVVYIEVCVWNGMCTTWNAQSGVCRDVCKPWCVR